MADDGMHACATPAAGWTLFSSPPRNLFWCLRATGEGDLLHLVQGCVPAVARRGRCAAGRPACHLERAAPPSLAHVLSSSSASGGVNLSAFVSRCAGAGGATGGRRRTPGAALISSLGERLKISNDEPTPGLCVAVRLSRVRWGGADIYICGCPDWGLVERCP
eukprot:7886-Prymnesium_polylepis.1